MKTGDFYPDSPQMSLAWRLAKSIRLSPIPIPLRTRAASAPIWTASEKLFTGLARCRGVAEQPRAKVVEKRLEPFPRGADDMGDCVKARVSVFDPWLAEP